MSKNSSRLEQRVVRVLDSIVEMDRLFPHSIKGAAMGHVKEARRLLLEDVRKRRDHRALVTFKRGSSDGHG